jgi:hypothetical protein
VARRTRLAGAIFEQQIKEAEMTFLRYASVLLFITSPAFAADKTAVTVDTFTRAETDRYFAANAQEAGGLGKLHHAREPAAIDNQTIIRMNRDTLYSFAVLDLAAGPATVTMPDSGGRFMSIMIADEDHYVPFVAYDSKPHTLTQQDIGTRYALVAIRTLVDPNDPKDVSEVHKLQDAIKIDQPGGPGKLELPDWDQESLTEIRDALLLLAKHNPSFAHSFGTRDTVDPIKHLIATAAGWGGNPDKDASYGTCSAPDADGKSVYKLTVPKDIPVDAFWSVSVYNAKGFFEKNPDNAYSVNNITGTKNEDGSVTVQFGGCDGKVPNCLPIMEGWNCAARMYRPRQAILDGTWKFPVAEVSNEEGRASAP